MLNTSLSLLALAAALALVGCGSPPCGPSNCAGCCSPDGVCQAGSGLSACGLSGAACDVCVAGQACTSGKCVAAQTGCGPGNCASGCCQGDVCKTGNENGACGSGGGVCNACPGTQSCNASKVCEAVSAGCQATCAGCCVGNTCSAGNQAGACGASGAACTTCQSGQVCDQGQCKSAGCSAQNPNGTCGASQTCLNGACCATAKMCSGACCGASDTCIAGACCTAANKCGNSCCSAQQLCMSDGAGTSSCQTRCTTTSQCGNGYACELLTDAQGTVFGACLPVATVQNARCSTKADCTRVTGSSACAPYGDASNAVTVSAMVCRPDNGTAYRGCNTTSCGSGLDCMKDTLGNNFCTVGCSSSGTCGAGGCCVPLTCTNSFLSCSAPNGCTACP